MPTMLPTKGYAAFDPKSPLRPFAFERREPAAHDVLISIQFCGVCHSDLHQVRDEWGGSRFPMVPGHEIVGRVVKVGAQVEIGGNDRYVAMCRRHFKEALNMA